MGELAFSLLSLVFLSVLQQVMDGGGEELGAGGLGLRQLGFQGVAQCQQLGHLRHDVHDSKCASQSLSAAGR